MHLLWSLGLKRRKFSASTPALLPVSPALQPAAHSASPPPLPAAHPRSGLIPAGPREEPPPAVATPVFYMAHLKRSSCIVSSSSSLHDDTEESSSNTTTTTTTTMTSTRNDLRAEEAWPRSGDEETDQPENGGGDDEEEEEETVEALAQPNEAEDEEHPGAVAVRRDEERRERKRQLKRERRERRERKREEKEGKKMERKTNNRGREEEDAAKRALREAEEEEEDMRVLLAACQLQGETRNQTAFACSGRSKDQKTTTTTTTTKKKKTESAKKEKKEEKKSPAKKSRRERKLEKRENKKDKKQRKIDQALQKQREKEEKRRSRNRGHARSSSEGAALASSNINNAAGLSSSASMPSISTKPKKSWRPSTWRSSIACLGRTPSMDGGDSPLQTSRSSDSHSLDGPRGDMGSSTSRRRSSIEKGKDKQQDREGDDDDDDDPDKKSGPGKVLEEGTMEPCGEDGEDEGWSEESVEWCGVKYAKNDLPPFDTSGLRAFLTGKTAYNPNHCLWLATAAALAYRSPAQIRHVVTRIWEWEDMEFFHNAETDTQGFGAYGKDCIVICFRGTESSRDWSTNIKISETEPFPDMPAVKVHNGFNRALTSVLEQVVDFIAKGLEFNPSLPLYITGHSLGGALANMCLAYFTFPSSPFLLKTLPCTGTSPSTTGSSSGSTSSHSSSSSSDEQQIAASRREPLIKGVYTFGQPKVGNEQFAYELRVHSAGTVFFRLTNNNDLVPFVPRRLYVHCGTRLFLSGAGHIVQGDEAARPAREFWRENNHGRMFKRKRQGFRDHLVKSYVAFLREHHRINEAILMSPLRKDMPLLRFHDMERAKLSCEEMRQLVSFDSVIEGLKHMTVSDLMDTRSLAMTAKQRKKEAQTLGRKWLREQLWEKLKDNEDQQIKKCYKALKCEVEKKKAKYRGDSARLEQQQQPDSSSGSGSSDSPRPAVAKDKEGGKGNGPIGAIFASFASLKDALRADS